MSGAGFAERPERAGRGSPRFKRAAVGALALLVAAAGLGATRARAARQGSNIAPLNNGNGLYADLENCINDQGQLDYSLCSPGEQVGLSVAEGYVLGAEHILDLDGSIDPPEDGTNGQTVDIVRMYLEQHPGTRNLDSGILILRALREAWPPKNVPKPSTP